MLITNDTTATWDLNAFMATIHEGRVALWSWHPEQRYAILDPLARRMWGDIEGARHTLDDLFARVHPEDRDRVQRLWFDSAVSEDAYEFDFRIGEGANARWISARGVGGASGRQGEEVLAVFVDVTSVRQANETRDRLIREMAHRTSNLFTVAQSMTRLSAAEAEDADALASDLERRFTGLAGAYRFAVTQSGSLASAPLGQVAEQIMSPFAAEGAVSVDVPDLDLEGEQITNIAVVLHELTTNALKYGALSQPGGTVSLSGELEDGCVHLSWRERGGPVLTAVPQTKGFGTRLLDHTVAAVFGGKISRSVQDGQLNVALTLDASRLAG